MRGLVVLMLVPDLSGGFAFHIMAKRQPEDAFWGALASQFSHVTWTGAAIWDLVMPAFVFLVGVSLGLSYTARRAAGASERELMRHAAVRSAALVVLGLLLARGVSNRGDELLPFAVLAIGLPLGRWWHRLSGRAPPQTHSKIDTAFVVCVLLFALSWMATQPPGFSEIELNQILLLIGLAYFPAAALQRTTITTQALVAGGVLVAYGAAFIAYAPPAHVQAEGEILQGIFAHWNNGTNVAAAFDRWLLNLWPGRQPYSGNAHGYHTLQFVPLISVILAGAVIGRRAAERGSLRELVPGMAALAMAGLALSWVLASTLFPLVKSLWTPSWTLFSTSLTLLLLAAFALVFDTNKRRALALPLVVLGSNALLLYVLAHNEPWRIVLLWHRLLGERVFDLSWLPVLEASLVLVTLWLVAAALHRLGLFIRL